MSIPTPPARIGRQPADRLPKKKPRTVTVGIVFDDQVALEHQHAEQQLADATAQLEASYPRRVAARAATGADDAEQSVLEDDARELAPLREQVTARLAALDDVTVWFVFQGLAADPMKKLARAHPPTEQDKEEHQRLGNTDPLEWSPETFPEALVAATCVSPTGMDWHDVFHGGTWGTVELAALVANAVHASQSVRTATHRPAPPFEG